MIPQLIIRSENKDAHYESEHPSGIACTRARAPVKALMWNYEASMLWHIDDTLIRLLAIMSCASMQMLNMSSITVLVQ